MLKRRLRCDGWQSATKKSKRITGGIGHVVQNELKKLAALRCKFQWLARK